MQGRLPPLTWLRAFEAAARRLRRIYVYLFIAQQVAWLVKLSSQPTQARSIAEAVARCLR